MNHEEYSLVRDLSDDEKEKTLTLKRDRSIAKDQKKLDEMKKKLHTDDECKITTLLALLTYSLDTFVERGSSAVEGRTRNRERPRVRIP